MYQARVPRAKTADRGQRLTLRLGEQPGHQASRLKERRCRAVVIGVMHAKAISLAGDIHEFLDHGQVGGGSFVHRHTLALSQANVVAPLGLHPGEDRLLVRDEVDVDRAQRLDALRAADKPVAPHPGRHLRGVGQLRLDLEQGSVRLHAERPRHGDHGRRGPGRARFQSTTGPLGTYATFWPQGKRRYRMLAPPRIGASGLGIVLSSARWAVQPNADFRCAQRAVCQDVAVGVGRNEIVPHSAGVVARPSRGFPGW